MQKTTAFLSALTFASLGYAQAPPASTGLKVTGFIQYRYEWTKNPEPLAEDTLVNGKYLASASTEGSASLDAKNETETTVWVNLDNPFNGRTRFHATVVAKHLAGRTTDTDIQVYEAYVAAKLGPAELAVGRFLTDTGLGIVAGSPFQDGLHISVGNEVVKAQGYLTKFGQVYSVQTNANSSNGHYTYASGDIKVMPVKGLTLCASTFRDITTDDASNLYKVYTLGAEYKYVSNNIPWVTLMAQYGTNQASLAKELSAHLDPQTYQNVDTKTPKAYIASAKILGAHPWMPGTGGLQIQYRNADPGFDQMGMSNPLVINNPLNWMSPSAGGIADNYKGFEISGELTLTERTILKAAYGFMKVKDMKAYQCLSTQSNTVGTVVNGTTVRDPRTSDCNNYLSAQIFYIF